MGKKVNLRDALASDPAALRAPPSWTNAEVGTVNGVSVLHAGSGKLDGGWHRQTSDEFLLVLEGSLTVEFDAGPLTAGPGEAILIAAGEHHRASKLRAPSEPLKHASSFGTSCRISCRRSSSR